MKLAVLVIALGLVGCGTSKVDNRMQVEREKLFDKVSTVYDDYRKAIASCNQLSDVPDKQLTSANIEWAKEQVKETLKDPWSAQFKNVKSASPKDKCLDSITLGTAYNPSERKSTVVIVGQVNSKNSYGGYAGFTSFKIFKGSDGNYFAITN